ncbi:DUF4232 domain-containing protein [Streptomyces sp. NPDC051130]|uniref:DUF4232 domain-containing protein n=1 Tax=Streptomyces sp. NPDC051130 TaxID=3157223 RepID=UPI003433A5FA
MRPAPTALAAGVLAATVLLTGCGTRTAASGPAGGSAAPSCAPTAAGHAASEHDGVSLISGECGPSPATGAAFRVSNTGAQSLTYTITFSVRHGSGPSADTVRQTVASVGPGQSVTRTVEGSDTASGTGAQVRISKVRAVPAAEAPEPAGACPPSGIRVTADDGDAAMGLRIVGIRLTYCGTGRYELDGYPGLQLLDEGRKPVAGVEILHGTADISTGLGGDGPPAPLTLGPGESASATLAWRNTTGFGDAVNAPYARVTAKPGAAAVTVVPELDLGTTGRLGVGAWRKDRPRTP